jgi:hypothetical protein
VILAILVLLVLKGHRDQRVIKETLELPDRRE